MNHNDPWGFPSSSSYQNAGGYPYDPHHQGGMPGPADYYPVGEEQFQAPAQPNYDPYHQFYDPTTGQYIMPANVYDPRAHQEAAYAGGAAPLGMVGPADGVYQGDPYQSHDVQHISATSRSSRRISTEYHTMYDPRTGQAGTPVGTSPPPNIARMGTPGIPNYPPKRPSHQDASFGPVRTSTPGSSRGPYGTDTTKKSVATDRVKEESMSRRKPGSEALFACPVAGCGQHFTANHNLQYHIKSHNNEREHSCQFCGSSFVRRSDCKRHEQKWCKQNPTLVAGSSS